MSNPKKKREYSCTVPECGMKSSDGFSRPTAKNRQAWIEKLGLDPNISVHRVCRISVRPNQEFRTEPKPNRNRKVITETEITEPKQYRTFSLYLSYCT